MVSPSFAIRDPRGRAPFPSRSRLCRSARGARVYNRRLVRGNFKTEFYGHESEVHDSSKTPRAIPYGQTVLPVSNHRALTLAKEAQSRSADYYLWSQLRAPRQVAAPRTRAEGPVRHGRTPTPRALRGGFEKTADVPSGGTTARGEDLERVKKQYGRHRRQPQLPRGGSRAHVRDRRYVHADELDRAERSSPGQPRLIATRERRPVPSRS